MHCRASDFEICCKDAHWDDSRKEAMEQSCSLNKKGTILGALSPLFMGTFMRNAFLYDTGLSDLGAVPEVSDLEGGKIGVTQSSASGSMVCC